VNASTGPASDAGAKRPPRQCMPSASTLIAATMETRVSFTYKTDAITTAIAGPRTSTRHRSGCPGKTTKKTHAAQTAADTYCLFLLANISILPDFVRAVKTSMIQYATIEEAWSASTPPARYPSSGLFDVGKFDERVDANFCDASGVALESAYPPSTASKPYDRMHGTRTMDTLKMHSPRDPGCSASPPEGRESEPESMYAKGSRTSVHAAPIATPSAASTASAERGRLYDILVFVLFGLLIVLAMHEVASLGESIGRARSAAASAARHATRHVMSYPGRVSRMY